MNDASTRPRPRSGSPTGRVRSASSRRGSVPWRATSSASTSSSEASSVAVDEFAVELRERGRARPPGARDRRGRRRERRRGADRRPLPRPAPRRAGVGGSLCVGRASPSCTRSSSTRSAPSSSPTGARSLIDGVGARSVGRRRDRGRMLEALAAGTAASPMVADGRPGPTTSRSRRSRARRDPVRRSRRSPVPAPRARAARRPRRHRRPRLGAAGQRSLASGACAPRSSSSPVISASRPSGARARPSTRPSVVPAVRVRRRDPDERVQPAEPRRVPPRVARRPATRPCARGAATRRAPRRLGRRGDARRRHGGRRSRSSSPPT